VAIVRGAGAAKQPAPDAPARRSPAPTKTAAHWQPAKRSKPPKQDSKPNAEKVIPFDDAEFADF